MAKNILTRMEQQLARDRRMSKNEAHELAVKHLQDHGSLYRGTETLTRKGIERSELGAEGRAIDRAAKRLDRPASDFVYSKKTNRARVKD